MMAPLFQIPNQGYYPVYIVSSKREMHISQDKCCVQYSNYKL